MDWPALPLASFITGKPATVDDVDHGVAVFCQQTDDDTEAKPFDIPVPQYAVWYDQEGNGIAVVLVQAEHHITDPNCDAIFGLRTLDGENIAALSSEVTLLGQHRPD